MKIIEKKLLKSLVCPNYFISCRIIKKIMRNICKSKKPIKT